MSPGELVEESGALADRVMVLVSRRGSIGIPGDELLRKMGVAYDALIAALQDLKTRGLLRVEWPTADAFRVMPPS